MFVVFTLATDHSNESRTITIIFFTIYQLKNHLYHNRYQDARLECANIHGISRSPRYSPRYYSWQFDFSNQKLSEWTGTGELVIPSERSSLSLMFINSFFSLIFFSPPHIAHRKSISVRQGEKAYTASGEKNGGAKSFTDKREEMYERKKTHHTTTYRCVWLNRARAQRNGSIDNLTPVEL